MPRFVILEHRWNGLHWDFMLEDGAVLKTWALDATPDSSSFLSAIVARLSADHRLAYLDFEGEVSGGRGHVKQWDGGTFAWLSRSNDEIHVRLHGRRLYGDVHLKVSFENLWSLAYEMTSLSSSHDLRA